MCFFLLPSPAYQLLVPDPPSNLSVAVRSGKNALVTWSPPTQGNYTYFKLKVLGISDSFNTNRTIPIENELQYQLRNLTPGATYQVQAYTVFDGKESSAYTSRNFTTSEYLPFFSFIIYSLRGL